MFKNVIDYSGGFKIWRFSFVKLVNEGMKRIGHKG
jgi:hypothetical protein